MNVIVHVEGGGNVRATKKRCRQGFSALFRKAGLSGRMPRIFAAGGREDAWHDFRTALAGAGENDFIVLLVDSEAPVAELIDEPKDQRGVDGPDYYFHYGRPEIHIRVQTADGPHPEKRAAQSDNRSLDQSVLAQRKDRECHTRNSR